MRVSWPTQWGSRRVRLRILPALDLGRGSSLISIDLGTLYPAIVARQCSISSASDAGAGDDHSVHSFTPAFVGNPDDRNLGHRWMAGDCVFDLSAVDVLATGDDHVFRPVDEEQVAIRIDTTDVACVIPAAAERSFGFLRSTPIALHDVGPAHANFADLTELDSLIRVIEDRDLDAHASRSARTSERRVEK